MKTKAIQPVVIALILCLPLFSGCKNDDHLDKIISGEVFSLDKIADNPDYESSPLVGTKWKLVGFVDGKKKEITIVGPDREDWGEEFSANKYTLIFEEDGILGGYTSTNRAHGKYSLSDKELKILQFGPMTEINEFPNGRAYTELMNKISSYAISSKGLALFYEDNKYLLFKPLE